LALTPIKADGPARRQFPRPRLKERDMKGHYHAVVWIDGREARVFHFNADDVEKHVIHSHQMDGREKRTGHHAAEDAHFLEDVTKAIADAGAILVTGPGGEKTALIHHIERKHPRLKGAIEAVESADHPTDHEIVADARKALLAADRMRPQM
jgi:stalled ribosome rescue protein Dom34